MEPGINDLIKILRRAWNSLLDDSERIHERNWYVHMREEDIRSYLFCKIAGLFNRRNLDVINLHADIIVLGRKRADIVLGWKDEGRWILGVEIKRRINRAIMEQQISKLQNYMANKKIESGVFLAIVPHSYGLGEILNHWNFKDRFKLEERDKENNNFIEWRRIIVKSVDMDWDALFLVLRNL